MEFTPLNRIVRDDGSQSLANYNHVDDATHLRGRTVYYRIKMITVANTVVYSNVIRMVIPGSGKNEVSIVPNPVRDAMQIQISSVTENNVRINLIDQSGNLVYTAKSMVQNGYNVIPVNGLSTNPPGVYLALVTIGNETFRQKVAIVK